MNCVYCGQEKKMSREHIFSKTVLDLFPECFLTYGLPEGVVHDADPVVKDVCDACNSKISYIDSYAKHLISTYFVKKYEMRDAPVIQYDYVLLQKVLLKYAYNDIRAHKKDESFFDEEIRHYILNEKDNVAKENVVVLTGFGTNTTPVPDMVFENKKLEMTNDPIIFMDTIVEFIDYSDWSFRLRDDPGRFRVPDVRLTYSFRFNSGRFLLFCFDKESTKIEEQKIVLKCSYPYALLGPEGKTKLPLCTSYFDYHHSKLVFVRWDPAFELSYMAEEANNANEGLQKLQKQFDDLEKQLAIDHKRVK